MSVIVIGRMTVDPGNVEKLWAQRKSDFDEWPDAGSFQKFFESYPKIPELMQAAGVQGPPEFDIVRAQDAPDQF